MNRCIRTKRSQLGQFHSFKLEEAESFTSCAELFVTDRKKLNIFKAEFFQFLPIFIEKESELEFFLKTKAVSQLYTATDHFGYLITDDPNLLQVKVIKILNFNTIQ